jgi:hypothetical protein
MRLVGAFDVIFRLAAAGKLFDYLKNPTWRSRTSFPPQRNDFANVEFVRHRVTARSGLG